MTNEKDARMQSKAKKKSYLVLESGLLEPLIKLLVRKSLLWELFGLPQHIRLIPSCEPREFLLWSHIGVCQHLKLFSEHFWL